MAKLAHKKAKVENKVIEKIVQYNKFNSYADS